jgi:hypothetical protein
MNRFCSFPRLLLILSIVPLCVNGRAETFDRQRPLISAAEAITMAEHYVAEHNFDVSHHFISSVRYIESGSWIDSHIGKGPYWQVTYELLQRSDGGQHFILIYMDGKIGRVGGL